MARALGPHNARRLAALAAMRPVLDRLYQDFDHAAALADPVELVRPYASTADREIAGFVAAGLAFGRVASINQSIGAALDRMRPSPHAFVRDFDVARDAARFETFVHRWTRGRDLVHVILILREMLREAGSVEAWFARGVSGSSEDVTGALESFGRRAMAVGVRHLGAGLAGGTHGAAYFFPRPSAGSACKRLNLYLRWMVRKDAVDPGGWTMVRPSQLVVPLDTHVVRVGQCLGLTRYTSPGWRMAREITVSLRAIDPDDPVKYDFALCHLGMLDRCGFNRPHRDARCPLRGVCRPRPRRPRASRGPSGPR